MGRGGSEQSIPTPFRSPIADPLQLLCLRRAEGLRCCLVTIVGIEGTSPRRLGAQLVVSEAGEVAGSISGGCLDTSVISQAMECLQCGRSQRMRYGAGSPYIDLTLPCGSGLDLQFDGDLPSTILGALANRLAQRQLIDWLWTSDKLPPTLLDTAHSSVNADQGIHIRVAPRLRVFVAGNGENLLSFCRLARASQIELVALHPDPDLHVVLAGLGVESRLLQAPHQLPALPWDGFTAGLTLFHDHAWEMPFLLQALDSPALLVGAMGSRRAQTMRLEQLRALGAGESALARLRGPIGILPRARDPEELAVSVLGELLQCYRQRCVEHGVAARLMINRSPSAGLRIGILAAGTSTRLGRPKQLVPIRGVPLLQHTIDQTAELVDKVWVVLGANGDHCWAALREHSRLERIDVSTAEPRLSASISTIAGHAEGDPEALHLLLILADQYRVDPHWLNQLVHLSSEHPEAIIASRYDGVRGVPAMFPRRCFSSLQQLHGDQGARQLLRDPAEHVVEYFSPHGPGDIDTELDLQSLPFGIGCTSVHQ